MSSPLFTLSQRYDVIREIGRGAHAIVYLATDTLLDRTVAIKLLRREAHSAATLTRFAREVRVTASLEHAHILHVHDTGEYEGSPFLVTELAADGSLAARLEQERQLSIGEAVAIATAIAEALAYAHDRGVLHRDLKPENILLGGGGALLADFGVAFLLGQSVEERITTAGTAVGTMLYMSPEQLCADREIDGRTDQYALACVLYEMLAGVAPHRAATLEGLRMQRVSGKHLPVRMHRPSIPAFLEEAIHQALSPVPADRHKDMRAFALALNLGSSYERRITDMENADASTAISSTSASGKTSRASVKERTPRSFARAGIAIAAVLGAAAWLWATRGDSEGPIRSTDTARIAILADPGNDSDSTTARSRFRRAVLEELAAWSGVEVINRLPVNDSTAAAFAFSATTLGDSIRISIARTSNQLAAPQTFSRLLPRDSAASRVVVASLVRQALAGVPQDAAPGVETLPTRSLVALRAFAAGHAQLQQGALDSAAKSFSAASVAAPQFAYAHFWNASTLALLRPRDASSWRSSAEASLGANALSGADSLLASALIARADDNYPLACAQYATVARANPTSFFAHFGMGECQRLDRAVLRAGTGYVFRGSEWSALASYRLAAEHAPSSELLAAVYPTIASATYSRSGQLRAGRSADSASVRFVALPSLVNDTLAFVPVDSQRFARAVAGTVPASWLAAMRKGRQLAVAMTDRWTERAPASAAAWWNRALALEADGQWDANSSGMNAAAALDSAANRAPSRSVRAAIPTARARLALRRGDIAEALRLSRRELVDSSSVVSRTHRAALAGFLGDLSLSRNAEEAAEYSSLGGALRDTLVEFQLRAAMGACEGLDERRRALETLFNASVPPADRARERVATLQPALRLAAPCLGPQILRGFAPMLPIDTVLHRLDNGDAAGALALLADVRARRGGATSSTIAWDYLYLESWALLAAGDSVAALTQLVDALNDIGSMSVYTLELRSQAAGLRRGLQLVRALHARLGSRAARASVWAQRAEGFDSLSMERL